MDKDTWEGVGCGILAFLILAMCIVSGLGLAALTEMK